MRKNFYYLFGVFELFAIFGLLFNHNNINYGISQLKGQLKVILNSRPIDEALINPEFPDSLKRKLILIQEIKAFAIDSIGINHSNNYNTVYDQEGNTILWVLSASDPYELKAYEWSFPFLGKVSYKGFFDVGRGKAEQEYLKTAGYDTELNRVGAWSTLGWFNDPVLSSMLNLEEGNLANLIIHELTHGTLFVKGDIDFNENLASFIGDQGALRFLKYKFGRNSYEMNKYLQSTRDEKMYFEYINKSSLRLDSLYTAIENQKEEVKDQLKNQLLQEIISGTDQLNLYEKEKYREISEKALLSGNAFFLSYKRYNSKLEEFEDELKLYNNDLKAYLKDLKALYPSL